MKEQGLGDMLVVAGGIVPEVDRAALKEKGIREVFGPGSSISEIADFIRENVRYER